MNFPTTTPPGLQIGVADGQRSSGPTHDTITTMVPIMHDDATAVVPFNPVPGEVVGVICATDILDLLARCEPRRTQH